MDLKEFISETLRQIMEGVTEAQKAAGGQGGKVSPLINTMGEPSEHVRQAIFSGVGHVNITLVEYDVALTVTEGTATKGGIGVALGMVALGSQGQSNSENSTVSRIKFRVPIELPSPD